MVCAKTEDCTKDMTRDGLDVRTDGEWVWADKTSLGGDNGIAVAMILAILSDETLPHPPIAEVFTVDEEVGMDGAFALDCSDLKGKKLLNLDSEEEGVFTVSCAGGVRLDCALNAPQERADGMTGYRVTISGLKGGHSGMNINQGRGNANCLMARTLYSAMERCTSLRVHELTGGEFDNVICLRADALAAVSAADAPAFEAFIKEFDATLKNEYAVTDGGISLACDKADSPVAFSAADTSRLLPKRPTPYMTPTVLWNTEEINRNHYGNAYVYMRKKFIRKKYGGEVKILDLWVMQSNCVQIVVDDAGIFAGKGRLWYVYTDPTSGSQYVFDTSEVMHFKTSFSFDGVTGLPVQQILRDTISGASASQRNMNSL